MAGGISPNIFNLRVKRFTYLWLCFAASKAYLPAEYADMGYSALRYRILVSEQSEVWWYTNQCKPTGSCTSI